MPLRSFNDNRFIFEEVETIADGLGPDLQRAELPRVPPERRHRRRQPGRRAPHRAPATAQFFESLGGSLIQSRATHPDIVERVPFEDNIRTFRISTNTLGAGFVEAICERHAARDSRRTAAGDARHGRHGAGARSRRHVPASAGSAGRISTRASSRSPPTPTSTRWASPAPLFPEENTSSGRDVGFGTGYDPVADPEDDGVDVVAFANFMRATKAPPRGPITPTYRRAKRLFNKVGCGACHTPSISTARAGHAINGGAFTVPSRARQQDHPSVQRFPAARHRHGRRHPGVARAGVRDDRDQIRTAPLWALRTRNRLMHDGLSFTKQEAIQRHAGQAAARRRITTR